MRSCVWNIALFAGLATAAWGGTFGKVVPIGGHASDLALDERRSVLYIANFTANRIEVMSLSDNSIRTSINVSPQPGSIALSPNGRYLVVAHFGNFDPPGGANNALTVIDLDGGGKRTLAIGLTPLGVAFGSDNRALVATTESFLLFDPAAATSEVLATIPALTATSLPVPPANFPPKIIAASMNTSGDGRWIYGLTDTLIFGYDVQQRELSVISYVSSPPQGPRVVSVNHDGSMYLSGWALSNAAGQLLAQFPNPTGLLNVGSHAIDPRRGLVYAQIPAGTPEAATPTPTTPGAPAPTPTPAPTPAAQPPVLQILDLDNLTVRERLNLRENLAGKSVLNSEASMLYAVSDSGVTVMPVGSFADSPRVAASHEDIVFRGGFCDRTVAEQEVHVQEVNGGSVDFTLSGGGNGITISPSSGTTPAVVKVRVDPTAFLNQKGTVAVPIEIRSAGAVNIPPSLRILVNLPEPDQRGTVVHVPGKLVDLLADPGRNRFYVLRQDKNQVLVFDSERHTQIATLRTGNTPTQMAITLDRRYLLVGNDNSQLANVFDLETLQPERPIMFPFGHYPRSLAVSGRSILAACRVAGPKHTIDRVDFRTRTAVEMPSLGIYENAIHLNTVLIGSENGSSILAAQADGNLLLYNASVDTFTISRKDFGSLSGAYAASNYDQFVVDNNVLNSSLVAVGKLDSSSGGSSGFVFVDQNAFRTTSPAATAAGVMQRLNLTTLQGSGATRTVESPLLTRIDAPFTRTLAPLAGRTGFVNLTTSGVTVLSWNYDASVAPPRIESIGNAADFGRSVAPGGLFTIQGQHLSPLSVATSEMPLPTALGESCLTVNGLPVPIMFTSATQINAQMPFELDGNVTLILRTPGGVSDNFNFTLNAGAPSVFRTGTAGPESGLPTIIRSKNGELVTLSNPIHRGESIVILLTGMGRTSPAVPTGYPAPHEPPAAAVIQPAVDIGGADLGIEYAGLVPGQVGVYQINAVVPGWAPVGMSVPLRITQGGQTTTLSVRVID